jgi:hypothetical protein
MRRFAHSILALTLALTFSGSPLAAGDAAPVSPSELHRRLVDQSAARRDSIAQLQRFFQIPAARKALTAGGIEPQKINHAIAALSDDELAKFSARAARAERDFAAGALTNEQLTYIVIALATAVVIIVIVVAD